MTKPRFRSGSEERVAQVLTNLGVSFEYEPHKIAYTIQANYIPDFVLPNGIYLEVKGIWDPADRRKMMQVRKDNPDLDIRMVFDTPYKTINKNSLTSYKDFCEKNGILWCRTGAIPPEWLI